MDIPLYFNNKNSIDAIPDIEYTPIIDNKKSIFIYKRNVLDSSKYNLVHKWLDTKTFIDGKCVSGREIPRQQLWYQKDKHYFCSSWKSRYKRWEAQDTYPTMLDSISDTLLDIATPILAKHDIKTPTINSCLINKYRDGTDSIRAHRDTYLSFGTTPVICGYSLGSGRILRIRRLHNPDTFKSLKIIKQSDEHIDFFLESNSLFVMAGYSQTYFSHEIPKMETCGGRYSLTFREFINE